MRTSLIHFLRQAVPLGAAFVLITAFQNCGKLQTMGAASLNSGNPDAQQGLSAGAFTCNAGADPAPQVNRRLNKAEYANTIAQLLRTQAAADYNAIMTEINPLLATIPEDIDAKFTRTDSKLSQAHVTGYLYVAKKIGAMIAASDTRAKAFLGTCAAAATMSTACLDTFLAGNAKKIYRRPLSATEIAASKTAYAAFASDKNSFLIAQMLLSPNFLMHIETEGTEVSPGLLEISAYELASRLSYHFLKTMPDDALFAAAADGSLMTEAGLNAQIDRLMAAAQAPQTKSTIAEFYSQWLGLPQLSNPAASTGAHYAAFAAGDTLAKASMVQEIEDMTSYYTFAVEGHFSDLMTSNVSFAKNDDLAKIYGVAKWTGDTANLVTLPPGQRSGLLTRAAFLANASTETNPVMRGVRIRRAVLCDTLAPPPPSVANMLRVPEPDPRLSTRQRYEHKTQQAFCMGCHAQINPLGFALENFDALGRYRIAEKIFDDQGNFLNQVNIDPVVSPAVFYGDTRASHSPVEFNELLAVTGKAQNCFVRQYFEFTYRQEPNLQADGCALEDLRRNLASTDGSLKKMFMSVAQSRAFKLKKLSSP